MQPAEHSFRMNFVQIRLLGENLTELDFQTRSQAHLKPRQSEPRIKSSQIPEPGPAPGPAPQCQTEDPIKKARHFVCNNWSAGSSYFESIRKGTKCSNSCVVVGRWVAAIVFSNCIVVGKMGCYNCIQKRIQIDLCLFCLRVYNTFEYIFIEKSLSLVRIMVFYLRVCKHIHILFLFLLKRVSHFFFQLVVKL